MALVARSSCSQILTNYDFEEAVAYVAAVFPDVPICNIRMVGLLAYHSVGADMNVVGDWKTFLVKTVMSTRESGSFRDFASAYIGAVSDDVSGSSRLVSIAQVWPIETFKVKFWSVVTSSLALIKSAKDCTVDTIWSIARKAFETCLGGFYGLVVKAASWIEDVWVRLKQWCAEMMKVTSWMAGFQECLVLGLGVVGVAAVLILVEKFMLGSQMIGGPLGLAQTFVLCFVGFVGLRDGGVAIASETSKRIGTLISACQAVVSNLCKNMSADATEGNGQLDPLSLLESFAGSLASVSSDKMIVTGRVFNSLTQIKSGCATIWSCVTIITDFLWDLLDKGFGFRSKALADLSVMLGMDVQGWLRKCDVACEHMCLYSSVSSDILRGFKVLKCTGMQIRSALLERSERGSSAALTSVNKALERLTQLITSATLAGSNGPRYEPLWIAFTGQPGVGKSTAVNYLVARYLEDHHLDSTDVYARNSVDPFWSGYRRQAVVTYDDLGALTNNTLCEEAELIKLVSRDALPLNMAGIEEKGMYFDSSLIVTSSNFIGFSPAASIHDKDAYFRRRKLLVEIRHKTGVDRCASSPVAHHEYVLRQPLEPFEVISTFETFEDFYAYFVDVQQEHVETQKQILVSMRHQIATLDRKVGSAVALLPILLGDIVPISFRNYIEERHPGWSYLIYHRGMLYMLNEKSELLMEEVREGVDREDMERAEKSALSIAMRYANVLRSIPNLDPLAAHYLIELVQREAFTPTLEVRSGLFAEDDQTFEVAAQMAQWQRAMVFVLSDVLSCNKRGYFVNLYENMSMQLQKLYVTDVRKWPMAVKVGFGVASFLIFGKTMMWALARLGNYGTGASFVVAATKTFTQGQSDDEVRKKSAEYRHRNVPIRTRHWSYAQSEGFSGEWLMRHCLVSFRYGHRVAQAMMLPGKRLVGIYHFFRTIPDGVMVEISTEAQKYHVCWHSKCLELLPESELAVYTHPTLREIPSSVASRCVFGLEHLPDVFPAALCSCKFDPVAKEYVPELGHVVVNKRNVSLNIYAGEYCRLVPACLEYKANTVNGDCGSLLIANINGIEKIVGIHVAGMSGYGQACFLPPSLDITMAQNWFEEDFVPFMEPEALGDGTQVVGMLRPEKQFFTQQKTSYVSTPESWHLGSECAKEPAILSKFDERLIGTKNSEYDPYRVGMSKYQVAAGPFEEAPLELTTEQIVEDWFDASEGFDFSECSLEAAVNGVPGVEYYDSLVLNTSEGYPYVLSRAGNKGKSRFLIEREGQLYPNDELMRGIERIEEESKVGTPVLVGIECAKDEKLPLKKIYEQPKTRLFTVLPMDYNIVVRRKFFPFVKFLMERRNCMPCQVGLNPYSREWGRVALTLLEKGDSILCCDYSRFDGILPKQVMFSIGVMINKLMRGSEELCTQRINLLMACCGRYGICAGKVWRVENGIPSGFPLTVILNSVFNEVIIRYLYNVVFWNDRLMRSSFKRYVAMVTYGDDNLISISPTIASTFNGDYLQQAARDINITITDGVDKSLPGLNFRRLEECDFLKRSFKKDSYGRWRAPMDLDSLWSQLHWVKTQHLGVNEAYLVNLEAVLRELYIHSPQMAREWRQKALALDWIMPGHLPTLEQLDAFHESQLGGSDFKAFAYDALLVPAMLGPIGSVEVDNATFEFRGLVATLSGKYKWEENDFVLALQVANKYECGLSVSWPATSGRGELPTANWLRNNVLRDNCEFLKVVRKAHKDGKRLVFLGRNSNVYSTVFLVLVGLKLGILHVEESNQILSKAIAAVRSLGYLLDVFPEAFFSSQGPSINSSSRRTLSVFGATLLELSLMRQVAGNFALSRVVTMVPNFEDVKFDVDHLLQSGKEGILVRSELLVDDLGGFPGRFWLDWVHQGKCRGGTGKVRATVTYFDAMNVWSCEAESSCQFFPGNKYEDIIGRNGRRLRDMSFVEKKTLQPVLLAAGDLFARLRQGGLE